VAEHLRRRAGVTVGSALPPSIEVAGHSLGAALATYYAAENALVHKIPNPALCTFASPKVGDQGFVDAFNRLGLTSWRIVNKQDIVPHLPPGLFYDHVDTQELFDSDKIVQPSFGCWHSLATYLHLLDSSFPIESNCQPLTA
jgi:Lipase (class 3)